MVKLIEVWLRTTDQKKKAWLEDAICQEKVRLSEQYSSTSTDSMTVSPESSTEMGTQSPEIPTSTDAIVVAVSSLKSSKRADVLALLRSIDSMNGETPGPSVPLSEMLQVLRQSSKPSTRPSRVEMPWGETWEVEYEK